MLVFFKWKVEQTLLLTVMLFAMQPEDIVC